MHKLFPKAPEGGSPWPRRAMLAGLTLAGLAIGSEVALPMLGMSSTTTLKIGLLAIEAGAGIYIGGEFADASIHTRFDRNRSESAG